LSQQNEKKNKKEGKESKGKKTLAQAYAAKYPGDNKQ